MDNIIHNDLYDKNFDQAKAFFSGMIGKKCSFQRAGEYKSLALGFGEKREVPTSKGGLIEKSEWSVGSYISAWRISRKGKIVCGNMDPGMSNAEMYKKVSKIKMGALAYIETLSKFDVRIGLDNDVCIDFMAATDYDDDIVHIFCPDHVFVSYKSEGWHIGRSDRPPSS